MEDYDENDYFESQYADELDILDEIDNEVCEISQTKTSKLVDDTPTNHASEYKKRSKAIDSMHSSFDSQDNQIQEPARKRLCFDQEDTSTSKKFDELFQSDKSDVSISDDISISSYKKYVFKRIPDGNFLPVTGQDDVRVYLSLKLPRDYSTEVLQNYSSKKVGRMLSKPYYEIFAEIQETANQKLTCDLQHLKDLENENKENININQKLWVDQYRPLNYINLLSDDGTNRTLLLWLKLWEKIVFNKENKIYSNTAKSAQQNKSQERNNEKRKKQFNKYIPELSRELDQHNRPLNKVALLCGAPGLGKTTLAHVIAKHAGYNVVEMNASDDRTVDVFRTRIEAATQMKSVLGKDPRPNCLIIDEIDGAPANSINLLIQMIRSTGFNNKKKKKEGSLLTRPIICICNDPYVPALKPLRMISLVLNFPPTMTSRLATRLLEVTRQEKMRADINTLYALCEKADNDIRSCLSTLQFICCKKNVLTMADIISSSIGRKDEQTSLFSVWQNIFYIPRQNKKSVVNPHDLSDAKIMKSKRKLESENIVSNSSRSENILRLCYAAGETQKVIHGMYENFLNFNFKDTRLEKVTNGLEWLCFSDLLNQEINHTQNYVLMPYLPYTCAAFHQMFAVFNPSKITYPNMDSEHRNNRIKMLNLVSSLYSEISVHVRAFINTTMLILDILPNLMTIIQPPLRPINTQLYTAREKAELNQLISIMISYNLTYHQERDEDGQFVFSLEPNMEDVTGFTGIKTRNLLTYTMRQLVAREIEIEKMKVAEPSSKKPAFVPELKEKVKDSSQVVPNHKQVLQPLEIKNETVKTYVDFFGRVIKSKPSKVSPENERKKDEEGVWFKFKEGYNNAVRKKVRIQDLMTQLQFVSE